MMKTTVVFFALLVTTALGNKHKDCEQACKLFERTNQNFLHHQAKVSCKKHNVSPRPTTEDICLSTFRALTHSACINHCDGTPHIHEACAAIAGTTWIPKHNAYRACRTGYREAIENVPDLVEKATESSPELKKLLGEIGKKKVGMKVHHSSTIDFKTLHKEKHDQETAEADAKAAPDTNTAKVKMPTKDEEVAPATAEDVTEEEGETVEEIDLDNQLEEFEFPITLDNGTTETLVVSTTDDVAEKVSSFCGIFMTSNKEGCIDQLLPVITQRIQSESG